MSKIKLATMLGLFGRAADKFAHHGAHAPAAEPAREHQPLSRQPDRQWASFGGRLNSVTNRAIGGVNAVEAEIDDGSESITLIWLGRQDIPGIGPGRRMMVSGRIGRRHGHRVLFNPRYVLQP